MLTVKRFTTPSYAQWEMAIMGMRNPMNSWAKMDSKGSELGENDLNLMQRLCEAGSEHRKYMRMLPVTLEICAPLYWWKEADTYKYMDFNSQSTIHKLTSRNFCMEDFSTEHLDDYCKEWLEDFVYVLNSQRIKYVRSRDKNDWWHIIQLLPSSYNQTRTVYTNYETLLQIKRQRTGHKLDEWKQLIDIIDELPNFKRITEGVTK